MKAGGPDPGVVFAAEYARLRDELHRDPAGTQFADLAKVLGAAEWSGFRDWVLRRCENGIYAATNDVGLS